MASFTFDLVSPEKVLVSRSVDMVTIPGAEGEFGVLAGHAPLIASLKPGVITVHDKGQIVDRLFVAGGFAEINGASCTVLAEEALPVASIDLTQVEADIQRLRTEQPSPTDLPSRQLMIAEAKRDAVRA